MKNFKNKKMAVLTLSIALLSVGGATVFAASNLTDVKGSIDNSGKVKYSTDNGKTESTELPDGAHYSKDKNGVTSISVGNGEAPKEPEDSSEVKESSSLSVKEEKGKTLYSVDGGKNWSESIPKGYEKNFK
ncbi:hypothetical protein [Xylocopilactobacillus apis]|uniref:Uncharacterized protein n=1 Tax=Xylocopilactobacillus apis TaxID=2932183 RepID=A0AAU9D543_9LACO|nr:hypothetical protein [Xylocopilactobacillus apis]BDR55937.1 hypothetical protein KIMC2_04990 [Xylocopilactobacillus apis]